MRKLFVIILFAFVFEFVTANDGGYFPTTELTPISISNVSIEYERLIFRQINGRMQVDVELHLNNEEDEKEYLLGFEYPQGGFDSPGKPLSETAGLLVVNNSPVKYEYNFDEKRGLGVLLYTTRLNKGINIVYHRYMIHQGFGEDKGHYEYILTTGGRWKDGIIKKLEIYLFCDGFLKFNKNSINDFIVVGYGKKKNTTYYLSDGYLYGNFDNFNAIKNIEFYTSSRNITNEVYKTAESGPPILNLYELESHILNKYYIRFINTCILYLSDPNTYSSYDSQWRNKMESVLSSLPKDELRIIRNTIYAYHGYHFKDKDLSDYFSKEIWYLPDLNISNESILLNNSEKEFIQIVQLYEDKK